MVSPCAAVEQIRVSAFVIPTDAPEADGTFAWTRTMLVTVEATSEGVTGLGYTYADAATAKLIETVLAPRVVGREACAVSAAYRSMLDAVRNLGHQGIAAMAISACTTTCRPATTSTPGCWITRGRP